MTRRGATLVALILSMLLVRPPADAEHQEPQKPTRQAEPVEKLGENLFRVGRIRVDTARREVAVPGTVNEVPVLEFIAVTKGGFKAYESALTLDTDAVTFNLALVLIGLDKAHAVPSRHHFDPQTPQGDPVEIWVEWAEGGRTERLRAEKLVYNAQKNNTLPEGRWVYTGSVFLEGRYLADLEGVLISFVHTPASIIEYPLLDGVGNYGAMRMNPKLNLKHGTPVTLTVRAIGKAAKKR